MLSKSAAKAFFLAGTGLSVLAFLGLSYDTYTQIPERTHSAEITPAVARGKQVWEGSNCMGCHTILGEGAYYAPELTKVMKRRGEIFVRKMLRDPASMYPGERQMVQYNFEDADIDALVAFLSWVGKIDTNGFPATPPLARAGAASVVINDGRPPIFSQICVACHTVKGQGGSVGPVLDGVADRYDADYLARWIHDPNSVKPGTKMPNFGLSDEQIKGLVTYLGTLKAEKTK